MENFKNYWRQSKTCGQRAKKFYEKMSRNKTVGADFFDTQLKRCLKLWDIVFLGTGHMIGAGIYILTGAVAKDTSGPALVISYVMSGFAAFLAALCYAEFGGRVPKAGSAYSYGYVTIGEFWAFIIGWDMLLENMIGAAALAVAWSGYVNGLTEGWLSGQMSKFGKINDPSGILGTEINLVAPALILFVSLFMALGARTSTNFNSFFASINLLVIAFTVIYGLTFARPSYWNDTSHCSAYMACSNSTLAAGSLVKNCTATDAFMPFGFEGVVKGAAKVFFSYVGFESIASAGEETLNPQRTIPLGTLLAMVIVTVAYILMAATLTLMVPFCKILPDSAFAAAFEYRHAVWAKWVVSVGALSGMTTVLFGSLFSTPRGVYAMALDGLLCKCFGCVHKKTQAPLVGVIVFGLLSALLALLFNLEILSDFVSIGTLMAYSIVACSVIVLRYNPNAPGSLKSIDKMSSTDLTQIGRRASEIGRLKRRFAFLDPFVGHPAPGTSVNHLTALMVVFMFCMAVLIHFGEWSPVQWWTILLFVILSIVIILCVFCIYAHTQNVAGIVAFKVPFVPVLPAVSLLLNIIFMLHLSAMTWLRFGVWLIIGVVIYFSYGIWHSKEGDGEVDVPYFGENDGNFESFGMKSNVVTKKPSLNNQAPVHTTADSNSDFTKTDHVTYVNVNVDENLNRRKRFS